MLPPPLSISCPLSGGGAKNRARSQIFASQWPNLVGRHYEQLYPNQPKRGAVTLTLNYRCLVWGVKVNSKSTLG